MGRPTRTTELAPYKNLMLRIPTELLEPFKALAAEERRSLNAQILRLIEDRLDQAAATPKREHAYSQPS